MILRQQLGSFAEALATDVTSAQAGTSTTLFSKTQTGLIAGVSATSIAVTNKIFSPSNISVNHFLDTSTGNGNTYAEFEVSNGSISFNRALREGFAKTSSDESNVIHTFNLDILI